MVQIEIPVPEVCGECRFMDENRGDYPYCVALQQNRGYSFDVDKKRFPNCPLKPVVKTEDGEKEKLKDMCRVLFNRCKTVGSGNGMLCVFCGMRNECKAMSSV